MATSKSKPRVIKPKAGAVSVDQAGDITFIPARGDGVAFTQARNLATAVQATVGEKASKVPDPIPTEWDEQAKKAREYYLTNFAVKNVIRKWCAFVVGEGVEATPDSATPDERLAIKKFIRRMGLYLDCNRWLTQGMVRGEVALFKDRKNVKKGQPFRLRSINPTSLKIERDAYGDMTKVEQFEVVNGATGSKPVATFTGKALEDIFVLRFDDEEWDKHGHSQVLPAFELVETMKDFRRADRATARRWSTIVRMLKVGGTIGNKTFVPSKKDLNAAVAMLNNLENTAGIAAPVYWNMETHGADGKALDTRDKVRALAEDIAMALDMYPVFLTGDAGDFATARVLLKVLRYQIAFFRGMLISVLDWVFDDKTLGAIGVKGDRLVEYQFSATEIDTEEWEQKLLVDLYDRGGITKPSLQTRLGVDPSGEEKAGKEGPPSLRPWFTVAEIAQVLNNQVISKATAKMLLNFIVAAGSIDASDASDGESADQKATGSRKLRS